MGPAAPAAGPFRFKFLIPLQIGKGAHHGLVHFSAARRRRSGRFLLGEEELPPGDRARQAHQPGKPRPVAACGPDPAAGAPITPAASSGPSPAPGTSSMSLSE